MRKVLIILFLLVGNIAHAQLSDFEHIDFRRADSIAHHYHGESLENLPLLAQKLTQPLSSQIEQFRAIYIWVCKNISNDYTDYLKNRKMRKKLSRDSEALAKWNAEFRKEMFRKLLKRKETICTGYAYLLRELANLADIKCQIIDGYGRTVDSNIGGPGILNHSWNAVQLNKKWYLCDPTWSSGYTLIPDFRYVHEYNDAYFLSEPELFSRNHYPLDPTWLLLDEPAELSEFLQAPIIYKHAFSYQMIPLEPNLMNVTIQENENFRLVFDAPDSLNTEDIYLELGSGENSLMKKPDISRSDEGYLIIEYPFQRRIPYDVHLKLGEEYISSYTVQVKKRKK